MIVGKGSWNEGVAGDIQWFGEGDASQGKEGEIFRYVNLEFFFVMKEIGMGLLKSLVLVLLIDLKASS